VAMSSIFGAQNTEREEMTVSLPCGQCKSCLSVRLFHFKMSPMCNRKKV
jgi:hypothetical protein